MTDYSKLPDKEINRAVDKALGHAVYGDMEGLASARTPDAVHVVTDEGDSMVDYCNSWADAGPIIVASSISLHAPSFREGWMAEFTGNDEDVNDGFEGDYFESRHQNPLRAAMIIFLIMKESKNDS
jgi:hypothetical protein